MMWAARGHIHIGSILAAEVSVLTRWLRGRCTTSPTTRLMAASSLTCGCFEMRCPIIRQQHSSCQIRQWIPSLTERPCHGLGFREP